MSRSICLSPLFPPIYFLYFPRFIKRSSLNLLLLLKILGMRYAFFLPLYLFPNSVQMNVDDKVASNEEKAGARVTTLTFPATILSSLSKKVYCFLIFTAFLLSPSCLLIQKQCIVMLQTNFPWKITFDTLYTNEFLIRIHSRTLSISSGHNTI